MSTDNANPCPQPMSNNCAARRQAASSTSTPIHRIAAQLASGKLPRRDPALQVRVARALPQPDNGSTRRNPPVARSQPRHENSMPRRRQRSRRACRRRTSTATRAEAFRWRRRGRFPTANPGASLQLRENQHGREQRVRDIRGEIELQPIQARQPADQPTEQEMESVEGRAADEHAKSERRRFTADAFALGSKS